VLAPTQPTSPISPDLAPGRYALTIGETRATAIGQRVCGVSRRGVSVGHGSGGCAELGLTRMHGLASASVECLAIDLSARSAHPPDTHRSGGVTY
jgi:hypothetical protein